MLSATLICTYVCVVCICICVLLCVVCVFVCVCIVCQYSCVDVCIGLRLMSSIILNSFTVFFELGVSQSNPGLTDSSNLPGHPPLVIHYLLLFAWNYMHDVCITSTYVVSGKSRLQY